jgi:MFS family permease
LSLLVKPIRADFDISDTEYSLLTGFAFVLMYSLAGIPLGWLVDHWSRRSMIAIGAALWSIMTAACGLANSFWRLFAARVGVGIGEATLSPGSYSLIADYFPAHKLSRALSVYALGIPIGSGLALVIGGSIIKAAEAAGPLDLPLAGTIKPWQLVFMAIGLPGLILAALTLLIVGEPARRESAPSAGGEPRPSLTAVLAYVWQNRRLYFPGFFGMALATTSAYGANAWYPTYLQRIRGFTIADSGLLLGAATLVFGIAGFVAAGWLADRMVMRGKLDGNFVVGMLYAGGLLVCGVIAPLAGNEFVSLGFMVAVSFFANTWSGVNAAALQVVTPNRMRGQVSAIYLTVTSFMGLGLGPTAVAFSTDHLFGRDEAVGSSLALVALVFPTLSIVVLQLGRKTLRERRSQGLNGPTVSGLIPVGAIEMS